MLESLHQRFEVFVTSKLVAAPEGEKVDHPVEPAEPLVEVRGAAARPVGFDFYPGDILYLYFRFAFEIFGIFLFFRINEFNSEAHQPYKAIFFQISS